MNKATGRAQDPEGFAERMIKLDQDLAADGLMRIPGWTEKELDSKR